MSLASDWCGGAWRRGSHRSIESPEQIDPVLEGHAIIAMGRPKSFHQRADRRRLWRLETRVLHVEVVDDLANSPDRRIGDPKAARQDFERAEVAVMAELTVIHVERNVLGRGCLCESEDGVGIDECPNQPR